MISPTGSWNVRSADKWAFDGGKYGGSRRKGINGTRYKHTALDLITTYGATIVNPTTAKFKRLVIPYANHPRYSGGLFENEWCEYRILYFTPSVDVGKTIKQGEIIGYAEDLDIRYPKIINHVHFEIINVNPLALSGVFNVT